MNKNSFLAIATAALPLLLTGCSAEIDNVIPGGKTTVISATVSEPGWDTRSSVDPATDGLDFIGLFWNPGDTLGIYGTVDNNVPFENTEKEKNLRKADFTGASKGLIQYAYYPYTAGTGSVNAVNGNVPTEQIVDGNKLSGDYKVGAVNMKEGEDFSSVTFSHLFSIVKLSVNAEGVESLTGENLESVSFTVTRGDQHQPVGIAGKFTFNLEQAAGGTLNYQLASNAPNAITAKWESTPSLSGAVYGYLSVIPEIKKGDKLSFTVTTTSQIATFYVTSQVDFEPGYAYNFPLTISRFAGKEEYGWKVEPKPIEGTFTCASLNVDGLPSVVNSGGPGSDGTNSISSAIANTGWDFFGVSENFEYNKELVSSLSNYNAGKYRGSVGIGQVFLQVADTDGLNFFWKNNVISAAKETMIKYNDAEGDLYHGANTCIKKGFRHYEVTVPGGVIIDVYITHMNTYSGSGTSDSNAYWKAQMSQLRQLRDYVIEKAKENNRPAIIMGDTNMRYTRHAIKEQFIDYITNQGLIVHDPWVDFHRPDYPKFGSKSLMINSKFWKDEKSDGAWYDTTNDICCIDNNTGEVVDKIFYINVPGADTQIEALSCYNDDSDNFLNKTKGDKDANGNTTGISTHTATGVMAEDASFNVLNNQTVTINKRWGLADHFPVVAKFKYTKKVPVTK